MTSSMSILECSVPGLLFHSFIVNPKNNLFSSLPFIKLRGVQQLSSHLSFNNESNYSKEIHPKLTKTRQTAVAREISVNRKSNKISGNKIFKLEI
ncbi:CLUMA_CG008918, isoform A [Clunio marinus]|uniref:CLUMA_CG008918, isoform A n=1 Tax=Clunio marinus TaxID=568069 RepID=A0A1J1IAJ7_9DIPT|nr:CLUMA_CG008918, isoform A [Clunio marinus]